MDLRLGAPGQTLTLDALKGLIGRLIVLQSILVTEAAIDFCNICNSNPCHAKPPETIEHGESSDGAAGQQTRRHPKSEREIVLIQSVNNSDDLQYAESAECDQRYAFVGFFAPHGEHLRHEKKRIAQQSQTEDDRDDLFHTFTLAGNLSALRRRALAISSSRLRAGAVVSREANRRADVAATSSIAAENAASLAFEGLLNPLILRTNCSDAARISSGVTGGSKLNNGLMFRHIDHNLLCVCGRSVILSEAVFFSGAKDLL